MLQGDTVRGYLFVTVAGSSGGESADPHFTLESLRRFSEEDEHSWFYSDRADPADYDTAAELASGCVDWYGTPYAIQWLPDDEAARIRAYFDHQEPLAKRLVNTVLGSKNGSRLKVEPDLGR